MGKEIVDKEEIIITLVTQVRDDVTDLSKSVARNNAKVVSNGTKLDSVIRYNKKCDERLGELEEWQAGHKGFTAGRDKKAGVFNSKTTLICTIGGTIIALAGLWFSIVQPALEVNAGVLAKIEVIEERYQASVDSLEASK